MKTVSVLQREHDLTPTGVVDERTGDLINRLLQELGLITRDSQPPPPAEYPPEPPNPQGPSQLPEPPSTQHSNPPLPEIQHLVRGVVRYQDGLPIPQIEVRAFDKQLRRETPLGEPAVTNADGLSKERVPAWLLSTESIIRTPGSRKSPRVPRASMPVARGAFAAAGCRRSPIVSAESKNGLD